MTEILTHNLETLAHEFGLTMVRIRTIHPHRRLRHAVGGGEVGTRPFIDYAILRYLSDRQGEQVELASKGRSDQDLAERFWLSKAAVSQKLCALEDQGLISRSTSKIDRRYRDIIVTAAGQARLREVAEQHQRFFRDLILRFGEDRTRQMIELINQFLDTIDQMRTQPKAGD
ncbi:MAG: MarR family winged helix-turn-helix transcriptional regulator [Coriobacteriales bacterium]|jgi:DNA-binding MarR family transcriptional regulator|nr:MarR family winged helix-turn-helix transcriptional regulator [Coriobacteriales bacterium]